MGKLSETHRTPRHHVGAGGRDDLHLAPDVDPGERDDDDRARDDAATIVGIAAGFAVFIAVFVVSSTFAFAVAQRRREFALLRTVGATRRQVRWMLYGEAGLVAVVASAIGAAAGPAAAGPVLDWLVGLGMAPGWLTPTDASWPSAVAFSTGVVVALCGVAAAAGRGPQQLVEGRERQFRLGLHAGAAQHPEPLGPVHRIPEEGRLADARVAAHHQDAAASRTSAVQQVVQGLLVAASSPKHGQQCSEAGPCHQETALHPDGGTPRRSGDRRGVRAG